MKMPMQVNYRAPDTGLECENTYDLDSRIACENFLKFLAWAFHNQVSVALTPGIAGKEVKLGKTVLSA